MLNLFIQVVKVVNNSPIIYIPLTGFLVFYITNKLNIKKEERDRKYDLFETLYSNFENYDEIDYYQKFKLIPVIFSDNIAIVHLFTKYTEKAYLGDRLNNESDEEYKIRNKILDDELTNIKIDLINEIASCIGYIKKGDKLPIYIYKPIWYGNKKYKEALEIKFYESFLDNLKNLNNSNDNVDNNVTFTK